MGVDSEPGAGGEGRAPEAVNSGAQAGGGRVIELGLETPPAVEKRQADNRDATNVLVQAFQTFFGGTPSAPEGLGALEACAGLWARGLAASDLSGIAGEVIDADQRNYIGRQLVRRGEAVYAIAIRDGMPRIYPATTTEVYSASPDPMDWWYGLNLATPSGSRDTKFLPASSVLHFRYATLPTQPWVGIAPLDLANRTGKLAAQLERSLGDEASSPTGFLLPLPEGNAEGDNAGGTVDGSADDPAAVLMAAIRNLKGDIKAVESTAGGYGDRGQAPREDYGLKRVGPVFTQQEVSLQATLLTVVCGACGVPAPLVVGISDGTAMRESWRRFLHATIAPAGKMVVEEVRRKLDPAAEITWAELAATDVAGRARAWRALVGKETSMPDADARKVVGIDVPVSEQQPVAITAGGET